MKVLAKTLLLQNIWIDKENNTLQEDWNISHCKHLMHLQKHKLNHNKYIRKWKDSSYGNKTVIHPFSSNKVDLLLSSLPQRGVITVCNDTKEKKTLWTYYFSLFPLSVGFWVEFISITYREHKIWVKDAKKEKHSIFQKLDLLQFWIPSTIFL